jgi:hypothetical protein
MPALCNFVPVPLSPSALRAILTLGAQPMPVEEDDDAEVPSPFAKRSKTVHFSPAVKALGGDLSQRQGQPLATLQLTSLSWAFSQEGPLKGRGSAHRGLCPVAESRESTPLGPSVRRGTDDHATQMRERSIDEFAANANRASGTRRAGGPGTPELSTAVGLLPRTPHFDAIARAAAGSSLDGEAEQSPPARSDSQPVDAALARVMSPLRRIQEATASMMQQLRNIDAANSQIRTNPGTRARSHVALPSGPRTALQPMHAEEPPQPLLMTGVNEARQEKPPPEATTDPAEPPPLQSDMAREDAPSPAPPAPRALSAEQPPEPPLQSEAPANPAWLPRHLALVASTPPAPTPPAPPPSPALVPPALVPPAPVPPTLEESSGGTGPSSSLATTEPAAAEPVAAEPAAAKPAAAEPAAAEPAAAEPAAAISAASLAAAAITAVPPSTSELEGATASSGPGGPATHSSPAPARKQQRRDPAAPKPQLRAKPQLLGAQVRVLCYVENEPAQPSASWLSVGFF